MNEVGTMPIRADSTTTRKVADGVIKSAWRNVLHNAGDNLKRFICIYQWGYDTPLSYVRGVP